MGIEYHINKLKNKENFECYGPLSEKYIKDMEMALNISFPEQYREFLSKCGYAVWFGGAIFGYSEDEDYHTVNWTIEIRENKLPANFTEAPLEGCVLESYAGGGYYFLFAQGSARTGEVVLYLDELFGKEVKSWPSFSDFIEYISV